MPVADQRSEVSLIIRGSCIGGRGPGGWGAILWKGDTNYRHFSGSAPDTTARRMELTAVIEGLRPLKWPCLVTLYSNPPLQLTAERYRQQIFEQKKISNPNADLWEQFLNVSAKHQMVYVQAQPPEEQFAHACTELAQNKAREEAQHRQAAVA